MIHKVLWPTLHYVVPDAPKTKVVYESSSFVQYKKVNEQFADAIVANYQEGDIGKTSTPDSKKADANMARFPYRSVD